MKKASLIIPSAKFVGIDVQNEFGPIPPVLLPTMGKIALQRIVENFENGKIDTYVGIKDGAELVENYFDFFHDPYIKLVRMTSTESLSDTVEKIIQFDPKILERPILINFADTVVNDFDPSLIGKDFIYFSETDETERWTLFKRGEGEQLSILDKTFLLNNNGWETFIGLFGFSDTKRFFEILKNEKENDKSCAFYKTIDIYLQDTIQVNFKKSDQWVDYGHIDNYYLARRRMINTRYFNSVVVNDIAGTLKKTSRNKKLLNEIKWYLSIPKELRYYVPNIFEYSTDHLEPYIEMELYSYPSLDDCFVYSNFDFDSWDKIFRKIFAIIEIAAKYTVKDNTINNDLKKMYYHKTIDRLKEFLNSNELNITGNENIYINDKKMITLNEIINSLKTLIIKFDVYDVDKFQVIHGDLCFGNILYDRKNGIIKLIDPRGEFGKYLIYGDVYYDIAKISHSVLGLYDFIIYNQYKITKKGELTYSVKYRCSEYHEKIGKIFIKHINLNNFDIKRVRFIETLLFLSMLPLHKDHPEKQKAMLFRGLEIMTGLMEA